MSPVAEFANYGTASVFEVLIFDRILTPIPQEQAYLADPKISYESINRAIQRAFPEWSSP